MRTFYILGSLITLFYLILMEATGNPMPSGAWNVPVVFALLAIASKNN